MCVLGRKIAAIIHSEAGIIFITFAILEIGEIVSEFLVLGKHLMCESETIQGEGRYQNNISVFSSYLHCLPIEFTRSGWGEYYDYQSIRWSQSLAEELFARLLLQANINTDGENSDLIHKIISDLLYSSLYF